jgi:protein O-GlcNAc transferase
MNDLVRDADIDPNMSAPPVSGVAKGEYFRIAREALQSGRNDVAEQAFRMAAAEFPDDPATHHDLGSFLAMNRRFDEAAAAYERALSIEPDDHETRLNLGRVYLAQKNAYAAADQLTAALALAPADIETRLCLADAARRIADYSLVAETLAPVLQEHPSNRTAAILMSSSLVKLGRFEEHIEMLGRFADGGGETNETPTSIVMDLFGNPAIDTKIEIDLLHRLFGGERRRQSMAAAVPARTGATSLTVGYLSNYVDKPNYSGFLHALVSVHDPSRFRVVVYSDAPTDVTPLSVETVNVGRLDNAALADRIRTDGVDILVDINGYSAMERLSLFDLRPAPVIVSWFNTFSTLGIPAIDNLIADSTVIPDAETGLFEEKLHRLDGCYLLWHGASRYPPPAPPPMVRNGYCTFDSLASNHKINPRCIDAWASVLHRVPESRFLMRNPAITLDVAEFYRQAFAAQGIDADRIAALPGCEHYGFVKTYERIDIALDTFSWNGGTTTLEGLWQGVPVVTFDGNRWVARAAASILKCIGRPEWIGETVDDYVDIAVELAQNAGALDEMRREQRERIAKSGLCDADGFARKLEAAYVDMHRQAGGTI